MLDGIIKGAEGEGTIKILNPQRLLRDDFARLGVSGTRASARVSISAVVPKTAVPEQQKQVSLISFDLAQQEYALPLDRVREIIPLPDHVSEVPRAETAVLGVVTLRDRLLPLVSLRALLGLPVDVDREEHGKVVVLSMGDSTVGMVADRTREILRVAPESDRSRTGAADAWNGGCGDHIDLPSRTGPASRRGSIPGPVVPIRADKTGSRGPRRQRR